MKEFLIIAGILVTLNIISIICLGYHSQNVKEIKTIFLSLNDSGNFLIGFLFMPLITLLLPAAIIFYTFLWIGKAINISSKFFKENFLENDSISITMTEVIKEKKDF